MMSASRTSVPESGGDLRPLRTDPSGRGSIGAGDNPRMSRGESGASPPPVDPPEVKLNWSWYGYYTLLPWGFFICAILSFTFFHPELETLPYAISAFLVVVAAAMVLPTTPPQHRQTAMYSREDVVLCSGFLLSATLFAFFFHGHYATVGYMALVLVGGVIVVAGDLRFPGQRVKKRGWVDDVPFVLCSAAIIIGSLVGYHNFSEHMLPYHTIQHGSEYDNVLPDKAAPVGDFGKLIFAESVNVETQYSVGYRERHTYCTAPILEAGQSEVAFWAVGLNCCAPRGSFWCSASSAYSVVTSQIASGSVDHAAQYTAEEFWVLDQGAAKGAVPFVERPFSDGWNVYAMTDTEGLHKARELAKELYELTEAPDAKMVFWTSNPLEIEGNLLISAWTSIAIHVFLYLAVSASLAFLNSFQEIRPKHLPMRFSQ